MQGEEVIEREIREVPQPSRNLQQINMGDPVEIEVEYEEVSELEAIVHGVEQIKNVQD